MSMVKTWVCVSALALALSGCQALKDNVMGQKTAKLAPIQNQIAISATQIQKGVHFAPITVGGKTLLSSPNGVQVMENGVVLGQINLPITAASFDGTIVATAGRDGVLRMYRTDGTPVGEYAIGASVMASPLIKNNQVIALSRDGAVVAVRPDGTLLWRFISKKTPISGYGQARVIDYGNDAVMAALADGRLYALDLNGNALWSGKVGSPDVHTPRGSLIDIEAAPLVAGSLVVASARTATVGFDMQSGNTQFELPIGAVRSPVLMGDNIVIIGNDGKITALSPQGQIIWQQEALAGRQLSSGYVQNGVLLVGDNMGLLHAINDKGELIARQNLGFGVDGVAQDGGVIYAYGAGLAQLVVQ